ncbi:Diphenol oxidase 2 [Hyphodiscus hymeniophilus]|uniref:Diphenol oxidase 2 n=1 Tax=Hyphodiscus hymeniophilus TaxID=353542 RepID=A0A9P6VI58_9HELO|nr:Diphenol oxidase 2 [Hyphodiscus hymeniophilus]
MKRICRRGPAFYLFLFLSAIVVFIFTYRNFSSTHLSSLFEAPFEDTKPVRALAIELHPKEHIRRLPTSLTHHWNITEGVRAPDGVNKTVYLINGEFPGPTIEARTGDQLIVVVSNQLKKGEGVAIHWHGLHMKGANHMDGVVGVTQKDIPAGEEFTYKFEISKTQAGTFWYHSHSELQRADGLYGGLVIHRRFEQGFSESDNFDYEDDRLLLVGDWYHRSAADVQASYLQSRNSENEPVPDSLLINGLGSFNCSTVVHLVECKDVRRPSMKMSPGSTRLRVVNVGAMSGFNLTLESGNMRVIKIDGGNDVVPSASVESVGILYPGERVDIISDGPGNSLTIALDLENFHCPEQVFTAIQTFAIEQPKKQAGHRAIGPMPESAGQTILVYTHIEMPAHDDQVTIGYMNQTNWIPQVEPLLYVPREQWDNHQFMPTVKATEDWVDIVVNNFDDQGHPFHLHGHDFYVLTRHEFPRADIKPYNPFDPPSQFSSLSEPLLYPRPNLENPPLKDTIYIPKHGYVILRIRADNIGVWFFHCHIVWPMVTRLAMGLDVR